MVVRVPAMKDNGGNWWWGEGVFNIYMHIQYVDAYINTIYIYIHIFTMYYLYNSRYVLQGVYVYITLCVCVFIRERVGEGSRGGVGR